MPSPVHACLFAAITLLSACSGGRSTVLSFIDKETAECARQFEAGELQTHEYRAYCETWAIKHRVNDAALGYEYGDLISLLIMKRMELARRLDENKLAQSAANAEFDQFYTDFRRELTERDYRLDTGARPPEFNYCKLAGNRLLCGRLPRHEFFDAARATINVECDRREDTGEIKTAEQFVSCTLGGWIDWSSRYPLINRDLSEFLLNFTITLAKRLDGGEITKDQYEKELGRLFRQVEKEIALRELRRKRLDPNWEHRACRLDNDGWLECLSP